MVRSCQVTESRWEAWYHASCGAIVAVALVVGATPYRARMFVNYAIWTIKTLVSPNPTKPPGMSSGLWRSGHIDKRLVMIGELAVAQARPV